MLSRTVRSLSSTTRVFAKAVGHNTAKKSVQFKAKRENAPKAKKGGMTHHEFRDAVTNLGYEKVASPISVPELTGETTGVFKYPAQVKPKLDVLGVWRPYQHSELFPEPVALATTNTETVKQVVAKLAGPSKDNRVCLVGAKGMGKSTLLAQAMSLAEKSILLHINDARQLTNGSNDYYFNKSMGKYQQPMYTKRWIWKVKQANADVFKTLKLSRDFVFEKERKEVKLTKDESTVFDLVDQCHDFGKYGPTTAFQFFVEELQHHSKEVPVLVTVDSANGVYDLTTTEYRHTDFSPVHVSELELGDWLIKLASGEFSFEKGGVILAETSDFGAHQQTMKVALGLKEYRPFAKKWLFDLGMANSLLANGGVKPIEVAPLTKQETVKLVEFYQQQGVLQTTSGEAAKVADLHYTLSSGVPGKMVEAAAFAY